MSDPITIELDADGAAALYAVGSMLHSDEMLPSCDNATDILSILVASTNGAPLEVREGERGRGYFATRDILAGEELFSEVATAWYLARAPGADGVYVMSDESGVPLVTLPPWAVLRTIRDTFTLSPEYALDAEKAYSRIAALTAFGSTDHTAWKQLPRVAPGAGDAEAAIGDDDDMPPRAQLLAAIAQCNAFSASLPGDSEWKRSILWPTLGRMRVPADRERLFGGKEEERENGQEGHGEGGEEEEEEESEPFSAVNAFFPAGSFFNHSCDSNVGHSDCAWEEGAPAPVIHFVARTNIMKGEEALLAYVDPTLPVSIRRRKLLVTYHFSCTCKKCIDDDPTLGLSGENDTNKNAFPLGTGANAFFKFYALGGSYPDVEKV